MYVCMNVMWHIDSAHDILENLASIGLFFAPVVKIQPKWNHWGIFRRCLARTGLGWAGSWRAVVVICETRDTSNFQHISDILAPTDWLVIMWSQLCTNDLPISIIYQNIIFIRRDHSVFLVLIWQPSLKRCQPHAFVVLVVVTSTWRLHKLDPALLQDVALDVWQRMRKKRRRKAEELELSFV